MAPHHNYSVGDIVKVSAETYGRVVDYCDLPEWLKSPSRQRKWQHGTLIPLLLNTSEYDVIPATELTHLTDVQLEANLLRGRASRLKQPLEQQIAELQQRLAQIEPDIQRKIRFLEEAVQPSALTASASAD